MANIIHSFCWTMSTGSVHAVEKKQYLADVKILDGYLEKDCIKSIFSIISDAFAVKNWGSMPFDCNNFKKVFVLQEEITAGSMARWIADYIITRCVDNDSTIHIESVTVYCDDGNSQEYAPKWWFEYKSFKYASNVTTKPLQTGGWTLQRMQEDGERSDPKNIPAVPDSEKKESYREAIDNTIERIMSDSEWKMPTMVWWQPIDEYVAEMRQRQREKIEKKKQWEELHSPEERSTDKCSEESEWEWQQNVSIPVNPVSIDIACLMSKVCLYVRLLKENEWDRYSNELQELESFFFHFSMIVWVDIMERYPEKESQWSIDSGAIDDGSAKTK